MALSKKNILHSASVTEKSVFLPGSTIGNESVPKIIINNTINFVFFLNCNQHFAKFMLKSSKPIQIGLCMAADSLVNLQQTRI